MAPKKGKTYRTANGKNIDFGAMILANETAPALGLKLFCADIKLVLGPEL